MTFIKKYWPSILAGIVALWGVYGASLQNFVVAHPALSTIVAGAYAIFAHLMPSPVVTPPAQAAK